MTGNDDSRFMTAAISLASRGRARSSPNPNVGCVVAKDGVVVGHGWTRAGGRPHAEADALSMAGSDARGATAWVTLEPCAHESARGPACADLLIKAGIARVVCPLRDPDPRTSGKGFDRLEAAGIAVTLVDRFAADARREMAGWWTRQTAGRPFVTLKLATSLDGCIALASGESRWITGEAARAHGHLERARSNMVLVGRGTFDADSPGLDVRLPGLEHLSPRRALLSSSPVVPAGWEGVQSPAGVAGIHGVDWLLVEGGAETASSFVRAGLADRILLYRAPILIGGGRAALGDIGLVSLADAHGRWEHIETRTLGSDTLEVYEARRKDA